MYRGLVGWCAGAQGGSVGTTLGIGTLLPPPLMPGVCRHGNSRVAPIEVTHTCKLGPRAHGSRYMPSRESGVSCIHCTHNTAATVPSPSRNNPVRLKAPFNEKKSCATSFRFSLPPFFLSALPPPISLSPSLSLSLFPPLLLFLHQLPR